MTTDNETETEEEENYVWMPMVEVGIQKNRTAFEELKMYLIHSGLDKQSAGEKAYSSILPKLQKELKNFYMQRLLWMKQQRMIRCIRKYCLHAFMDSDDFDPEEAMKLKQLLTRKISYQETFKRLQFY